MSRLPLKLAGLIAALCLGAALVGYWFLDRPPAFVVNQFANHFAHKDEGLPRDLANWLIGIGIADDWSRNNGGSPATTYPLLLTAANNRASYPYQTYIEQGRPLGLSPGAFRTPVSVRPIAVASSKDIAAAVRNAAPGDVISIAPGSYHFQGRSIPVRAAGSPQQPIYLRAEQLGAVTLTFDMLEGFHVMAPFWVFENLRIEGVCQSDSRCEHAFHVVGKGSSFTLRNSELLNFNAPLKVNLQVVNGTKHYPDYGLVEYNSVSNERPRNTGNPVTLLNIDSVDGWVVRGNYIADFVKAGGDHTSYGAFMKGNGRGGLFERNLVLCEHRLPADQGVRVGLSFGGGGTGKAFCRHGSCGTEQVQGVMRNNIIANCSRDVGIYLNRAYASEIHHNLLYNTLGIDVRFESSTAVISNNIVSGRIKERDGGQAKNESNLVFRGCVGSARHNCELTRIYHAPGRADFRLKSLDNVLLQPLQDGASVHEDFCGRVLPDAPNIGPLQYSSGLDCLAASPTAGGN